MPDNNLELCYIKDNLRHILGLGFDRDKFLEIYIDSRPPYEMNLPVSELKVELITLSSKHRRRLERVLNTDFELELIDLATEPRWFLKPIPTIIQNEVEWKKWRKEIQYIKI